MATKEKPSAIYLRNTIIIVFTFTSKKYNLHTVMLGYTYDQHIISTVLR